MLRSIGRQSGEYLGFVCLTKAIPRPYCYKDRGRQRIQDEFQRLTSELNKTAIAV